MRDLLMDYLTPESVEVRRRDQAVWDAGEPLDVQVDGNPVAAVSIAGDRPVLLVHGWQGRAGQMSSLATRLTAEGHGVVLADMPAHGSTPGWSRDGTASFGQFSSAIAAVASAAGGIHGVVGHSGGALSAVMAMSGGLAVDRFIGIGMLPRLRQSVGRFLSHHDATPAEATALEQDMALRFGDDVWERTDAHALVSERHPSCDRALIVHDRDDDQIPLADVQALADDWPGSELVVTQRFGHHLVLRRVEVADRVVDALG